MNPLFVICTFTLLSLVSASIPECDNKTTALLTNGTTYSACNEYFLETDFSRGFLNITLLDPFCAVKPCYELYKEIQPLDDCTMMVEGDLSKVVQVSIDKDYIKPLEEACSNWTAPSINDSALITSSDSQSDSNGNSRKSTSISLFMILTIVSYAYYMA